MIKLNYNFKGVTIPNAAIKVMHIKVGIDNSLYALAMVFPESSKDSHDRMDAIDALDVEMVYDPKGGEIFKQVYSNIKKTLGVQD